MVHKVVAYITRERNGQTELLVFDHLDFPDAGTQVPAGTLEHGEMPEQALWREVGEETGQSGFEVVRQLATYDFVLNGETYRRHVFHLRAPAHLPERWTWGECCGTPDQITFEFYWLPLHPTPKLSGGQGDHLDAIADSNPKSEI